MINFIQEENQAEENVVNCISNFKSDYDLNLGTSTKESGFIALQSSPNLHTMGLMSSRDFNNYQVIFNLMDEFISIDNFCKTQRKNYCY